MSNHVHQTATDGYHIVRVAIALHGADRIKIALSKPGDLVKLLREARQLLMSATYLKSEREFEADALRAQAQRHDQAAGINTPDSPNEIKTYNKAEVVEILEYKQERSLDNLLDEMAKSPTGAYDVILGLARQGLFDEFAVGQIREFRDARTTTGRQKGGILKGKKGSRPNPNSVVK